MGLTPLSFTGISQYSDDFQTILKRAASIANIPVQQIQNEQSGLLTKKQLLTDLGGSVSALASAAAELNRLGGTRALGATTTNANRVAITDNGASVPASYTITEISSLAKAASESTVNGYATADRTAVASGEMELVFGTTPEKSYKFTLADGKNNLNGLAEAINNLKAGVAATVLNTGTGDTPCYLSLTALASGATKLQLRSTPGSQDSNVLTSSNQGADAVFKLNGKEVRKPDNVITGVVPDVTLSIGSLTNVGESVVLSLSSDRSKLASALQKYADAYNEVATKLNAQIGPAAGLLSGDTVVREVQKDLRAFTSFRGDASVNSLTELGIELDKKGVMSFHTSTFYALSNTNMSDAYDLLGAVGFTDLCGRLSQITDPLKGIIKTQQDQYDVADQRLTKQVTAINERVASMQASLSAKLQAADSLLASLASQQSMLDASIQSVNLALFGKKDG